MQKNKYTQKVYYFKKSLVIHEGNTKQISTMTVTLDLIKHIDVRNRWIPMNMEFKINELGILYKMSS